MADNFETQIDPKEAIQEILTAIKRNSARVVFTTLVFLMIGMFVAMIWPSKFESSTQFVLRDWQIVDANLLGDLDDISVPNKLRTLQLELRSRKRIEMVMNELQWVEWLATLKNPSRRRDLAAKIGENLKVAMDQDATGAYSITLIFQWTSPRKAADFVNSLRTIYIELTLETHRRRLEEAKERAEAKELERQVTYNDARSALQRYEQENDVPSLLNPEVNAEMMADLNLKLGEEKAAQETTVQELDRLLAELETIDPIEIIEKPPEDPEHAAKLAVYEAAKTIFEEIDQDYFPKHPKHIKASKALKDAQAKLDEFGGPPETLLVEKTSQAYFDKSQEVELARTDERRHRALIEQYEGDIAIVTDRMRNFPRVQSDLERLQHEVEVADELLASAKVEVAPLREQVRQLRQRALMSMGADADVVSTGPFEVLDNGLEPETAVLPINGIILAVSLLLGIAVGILGPVLTEMTRSSFGTAKEVSRQLGVPVLGAVDVILTARDTRARAVQRALTLATMLLVLLALGTALYILHNHRNIVPQGLDRTLREVTMALV